MGAQLRGPPTTVPTSAEVRPRSRPPCSSTPSFSGRGEVGIHPANNFDPAAAAVATYGSVSYELANMEWWNLLNGRPQLAAGSPPTVSGSSFVGRWGENVTRLDPNVVAILGGSTLSAGVSIATDPFPLPGTSGR